MRKHILAKTSAEIKPSKKLEYLFREIQNTKLLRGFFADLFNALIKFNLSLLHFFLDLCRLNASILDELFKCQAGYLAPERIEGRNDYCVRAFIDYKFNSGHSLQCPYVPALAPDDLALQVFRRQSEYRCRDVSYMRTRIALNRGRHDVQAFFLNLLFAFVINFKKSAGKLVFVTLLNVLKEFFFGCLGRKTSHFGKLRRRLLANLFYLRFLWFYAGVLVRGFLFFCR